MEIKRATSLVVQGCICLTAVACFKELGLFVAAPFAHTAVEKAVKSLPNDLAEKVWDELSDIAKGKIRDRFTSQLEGAWKESRERDRDDVARALLLAAADALETGRKEVPSADPGWVQRWSQQLREAANDPVQCKQAFRLLAAAGDESGFWENRIWPALTDAKRMDDFLWESITTALGASPEASMAGGPELRRRAMAAMGEALVQTISTDEKAKAKLEVHFQAFVAQKFEGLEAVTLQVLHDQARLVGAVGYLTSVAEETRENTKEIRDDVKKLYDIVNPAVNPADFNYHLVPDPTEHFVGREADLADLHRKLTGPDRVGILTGVYGLSGIGKSELARAYAHAHRDFYSGGCCVLAAEGQTKMAAVVTRQAHFTVLFDRSIPEGERNGSDQHGQVVLQALGARTREAGPFLLILDNVDSDSLFTEKELKVLNPAKDGLYLLVTTRIRPKGATDKRWQILEKLPFEAAVELLGRYAPFGSDEERVAAEAIAQKLDGFTLALSLVGAYVAQGHGTYSELQNHTDLALLDALPDEVSPEVQEERDRQRLTLILGWVLERLSPSARRAVEFASLIGPEAVCLPWLKDLLTPEFPEMAPEDRPLHPFRRVVRELEGAALLSASPSVDERLREMHRMAQAVVRATLDEEDLASTWEQINQFAYYRANSLVNAGRLVDAVWEMNALEGLLDQGMAIAQEASADLLSEAALVLHLASRWTSAEPLMRRALAIDESSYGPDHPRVAVQLNNLAQLLQATNRWGEAEPLMRRALAIDESSYGQDHPRVAVQLNNLAQLLQATNRLGEAEPLILRALEIDESSYGPDHPRVAVQLNNLAQLLQDTGQLSQAESLMRRALTIDESSYGPDHPRVAVQLNNLAVALFDTNRWAEAEPLIRRALAIDESSYGPDHPDVAVRLSNLAALLQATNRPVEAEPLIRRALAIDESSYGPDHPRVAVQLNNLAQLLQATNRLGEAEPLMRRALAIDESSYGPDHPVVARDLNNLAALLQATDRLAEAEPLMRRAVVIFFQLGPDHSSFQTVARNYLELCQAQGKTEEEAVQDLLKLLGIGPEAGPKSP